MAVKLWSSSSRQADVPRNLIFPLWESFPQPHPPGLVMPDASKSQLCSCLSPLELKL